MHGTCLPQHTYSHALSFTQPLLGSEFILLCHLCLSSVSLEVSLSPYSAKLVFLGKLWIQGLPYLQLVLALWSLTGRVLRVTVSF